MRIPLARLIVRSPLSGIATLMERVVQCSEEVPALIECLTQGQQPAIEAKAREISVLEGRADDAKNAVRESLPHRLFLPVDRRDVLKLISQIDAIADCAEDVGVLLTIRVMEVPVEMRELLHVFVQRVMETVRTAAALVGTLAPLLESGFSKKVIQQAKSLIDELHRKEHEADKVQDQIAKVLFRQEGRLSPVAIFMWTKVLNKVGDMANHAENVGDQFRLLTAR